MRGEMIDNLFAAIAGDDQRFANSRAGQRIELMIEDRPPADLDKAFRHGLRQRQQTRPAAGGKNDTFHGGLTKGRAQDRQWPDVSRRPGSSLDISDDLS